MAHPYRDLGHMETAIPYTPTPDSSQRSQVMEALCKYPTPSSTAMCLFFPDQIPAIDLADLPRLQLHLSIEIEGIDTSPSISIHIAGVRFAFYPSGMERVTATYSFRAGTTLELNCTAGGGVAPGSTSWQIIPAHYIAGVLPRSGPVPLAVEGAWTNLTLVSVGVRIQLAPVLG